VPTAAPRAGVACRGRRDGRPHRPQSTSGHRSRRSGKPARSVRRSLSLPSCVLQLAPLSPAKAARTTRGRPQLRPQDRIRSQTRDRRPIAGPRHPLRPRFARSSSAGHRWPAARDTSWPTRITSSGRHIMRRSMRQAPSAASTRPPRRTAAVRAGSGGRSSRGSYGNGGQPPYDPDSCRAPGGSVTICLYAARPFGGSMADFATCQPDYRAGVLPELEAWW
jgi:hypothetical protein